jgi:hypothetical protein
VPDKDDEPWKKVWILGLCLERWKSWKLRLSDIVEFSGVAKMAQQAIDTMERVRYREVSVKHYYVISVSHYYHMYLYIDKDTFNTEEYVVLCTAD